MVLHGVQRRADPSAGSQRARPHAAAQDDVLGQQFLARGEEHANATWGTMK